MLLAWWSLAAHAQARHPCTEAADLGPGRYERRSVVVFPVQVDPETLLVTGTWKGTDPEGHRLQDAGALLTSVASGLFSTDWPLPRFDAWYTTRAPSVGEDGQLRESSEALRCTDVAVIPRMVDATLDAQTGKVALGMSLEVFQRADGDLVRTHSLLARAPGLVDSVEDMMVEARQQSVDKIRQSLPVRQQALDRAELAGNVVLDLLPADQAKKAEAVATQSALAVTRVASVARPAVVLPVLEKAANPGIAGLGWRQEEDRCSISPPKAEETERIVTCQVLNRVRQAVRQLQLDTRKIDSFRLYGPFTVAYARPATPIGEAEGLKVGDGYFVEGPSGRVGYARVRRVGDGGADGVLLPSRLQVMYGPRSPEPSMSVREDPRLGIEMGVSGGALPARRPAAALPDDPLEGGPRQISAGSFSAAGSLRFDVNLGRTARMYEWYQTNRIVRAFSGPLRHGAYTFGLEHRIRLLSRTSLVAGAGAMVGSWSVPSGVLDRDDKGEPTELRATANRIGAELELGLQVMLSPGLSLRAAGTGRLVQGVDRFEWSDGDERSGVVRPEPARGRFAMGTSGMGAGVSTAWVF
jgi:hypothetical protein